MASAGIYPASSLTAADVLENGARHVAIATGAKWRRDGYGRAHQFPIPGTDGDNVLTPDDVMDGAGCEGAMVIYDDDHYYMGSVIAEKLVELGCRVILATPDPVVASWTTHTLEQHRIQSRLLELGVEMACNQRLLSISNDHVTLEDTYSGRAREIEAASIVMTTSRIPDDDLYRTLRADPEKLQDAGIRTLRRIGDCHGPSTIAAAVYEGHRFARELGEEAAEIPYHRELTELSGSFELPG
jgi:dimethylamine/trimethylamine dehydrogenase